jgi:hypothetical protein
MLAPLVLSSLSPEFSADLAGVLALNSGFVARSEFLDDEFVIRLQHDVNKTELNGNGVTPDDAAEILLVRAELSGALVMPEVV